jgi:nucleoside-diphosphate-sugar epimerase
MEALSARGLPVRAINRAGRMPQAPQGVEVVAGDVTRTEAVRALTRGAAVVYQCAQPPYQQWQAQFLPMQAAIIDGLAGSGTKLVIGDNLYMYGDPQGQPIHEEMPYRARTRKGLVRAQMAAAALAAHEKGNVRVAIGRGSDFFGPWVKGSVMGERVFAPALRGKPAQLIGRIHVPHTFTFIRDFGRALVLLGERDEADGQAWHVPNDRPEITQAEFVEMIYEELGQPPQMNSMGRIMLSIGGMFIPEARETIEMMYEFEHPFVVRSDKFERQFGMQPTPLRDAIRETVAWYREHIERP